MRGVKHCVTKIAKRKQLLSEEKLSQHTGYISVTLRTCYKVFAYLQSGCGKGKKITGL